jgi:hypothetical protein
LYQKCLREKLFKNQQDYINRFNAVLEAKEPVFDEEIELADGGF